MAIGKNGARPHFLLLFDSKEDIILNLGNFLFEFNHLRAHGGLAYNTPFDKLESVTELLS